MKGKGIGLLLFFVMSISCAEAQRLIQYTSGMGARMAGNGDVWILYKGVRATHEGMSLKADSAHFNAKDNSFEAFRNVEIEITDTTHIYGDHLMYDGNMRVVDIWADTVVLVDGRTVLLANHLTYERDIATAYYTEWGDASNEDKRLTSEQGEYNVESKEFYIYGDVHLSDSASVMITDTLIYNMNGKLAFFQSPTIIRSGSSTIYSELGKYHSDIRYAESYRASHVDGKGSSIDSDSLFYNDTEGIGHAFGNVVIVDSANDIHCYGRYGNTHREMGVSMVTDSAEVVLVDKGDSIYLHADTLFVYTDSVDELKAIEAYHHVKAYKSDAQALCDSAYYLAIDSTIWLIGSPILWQEHAQCTADTIQIFVEKKGAKSATLRNNCMVIEQVDREKYNQIKGKRGEVAFEGGKPQYADIIGNAQMVYYITEEREDSTKVLVGVNVGVGATMRIYLDEDGNPTRVVTYENPDMKTYPIEAIPSDEKRLPGFRWHGSRRPQKPSDVFVW